MSTNHHNVNMRKDAIVGLQEIATSSSTQVIRHLDKLLGRIAALTSDLENVIRKENMKLATLVISMVSIGIEKRWRIMYLTCQNM